MNSEYSRQYYRRGRSGGWEVRWAGSWCTWRAGLLGAAGKVVSRSEKAGRQAGGRAREHRCGEEGVPVPLLLFSQRHRGWARQEGSW